MKRILRIVLVVLFIASCYGCKKMTEQEKLEQNLREAIANHEKSEGVVDSVKILSIDSLSQMQYAGLILEQLENMEFECELALQQAGENAEAPEVKELELTVQEIRDACDFYRDKFENGSSGEDGFFIFFIDAEIYRKGEAQDFFYLITPDFIIHDDPFGDNLLE
ncbi:MAG: hypothetical protein MJZ76_00840 [Bacteroidales bacterium]|nr:hypothetical protein [Bacteroidales bacterium]